MKSDSDEYIYVKSYRHKATGKLMVAAHYGLKAFRFKATKRRNASR